MVGERPFELGSEGIRLVGKAHEVLRPSIAVAAVVLVGALLHGRPRRFLAVTANRRPYGDTPAVRVVAIRIEHHLARHFGHELGVSVEVYGPQVLADSEWRGLCNLELAVGQVIEPAHPP